MMQAGPFMNHFAGAGALPVVRAVWGPARPASRQVPAGTLIAALLPSPGAPGWAPHLATLRTRLACAGRELFAMYPPSRRNHSEEVA